VTPQGKVVGVGSDGETCHRRRAPTGGQGENGRAKATVLAQCCRCGDEGEGFGGFGGKVRGVRTEGLRD
jgi:hypothetical protein